MSDCDDRRLSAYVDGELSRHEREAVERHLDLCPPCAEAVRQLQAIVAAARTLPVGDAPTDPWDRIREELERHGRARPWHPSRRTHVLAAAAALTVLAAGAIWLAPQRAGAPGAARGPEVPEVPAMAPSAAFEDAYRGAIAHADRQLRPMLERIGEPERRILVEPLADLDAALAELRRELEADPSNLLLLSLYQRAARSRLERTRRISLTMAEFRRS